MLAAKPEVPPAREAKAAEPSSGPPVDAEGFETIHLPDMDVKDWLVEDESISVETLTESEQDS